MKYHAAVPAIVPAMTRGQKLRALIGEKMRFPLHPRAAPNPAKMTRNSNLSLCAIHMNRLAGMAVKIAMTVIGPQKEKGLQAKSLA